MRLWDILPRNAVFVSRLRRAFRYSRFSKLRRWLKGKTLHWALYLALAALIVGGSLGLYNLLSSYFFVVRVNGHEVGLVRDAEEVTYFVDDLLARCSSLYGMEVTAQQEITFTREFRPGQEADLRQAKEALRKQISLVTEAFMVMVDGSPVVPVSTEQDIETAIELLSAAYVSQAENVLLLEVELVEEVYGERCIVPPDQICTPEKVASLLTVKDQPQELALASRDVLHSRFGRGESAEAFAREIPVVHVITVEKATVLERIPFSTAYVDNSNMFIGQSRVVSPGADGRKEVTYRVTRENGAEIAREALAEKVLEEPVTQVVERGSGRRFSWPVANGGRITQFFRGSAHMGVDIAAPLGTPILAADSGVVVRSENVWPMGNYIILYHGSYWTVYLHHSRNLVSAGQSVSRGQKIAYLGSTGRSTGPHLHFEVRLSNGSSTWGSWRAHPAVDPMQFFR